MRQTSSTFASTPLDCGTRASPELHEGERLYVTPSHLTPMSSPISLLRKPAAKTSRRLWGQSSWTAPAKATGSTFLTFPTFLIHNDLMASGCYQAANLVTELPFDDTAWIYIDGSSGNTGHGKAFAIFWQQQRYVLCRSSPSPMSGGSEQWVWPWRRCTSLTSSDTLLGYTGG